VAAAAASKFKNLKINKIRKTRDKIELKTNNHHRIAIASPSHRHRIAIASPSQTFIYFRNMKYSYWTENETWETH
jgi:hypothetical protein